MKLTKFWARGYRSLRDVTLEALGDYNIFYGPNGAGKSNILDAIQSLFCVMPLAVDATSGTPEERLTSREAGRRAAQWICSDDFTVRQPRRQIVLGAVIEDRETSFGGASYQGQPVSQITFEVGVQGQRGGELALLLRELRINDHSLRDAPMQRVSFIPDEAHEALRLLTPASFTHLGVTRSLAVNGAREGAGPARTVGTIPDGEVIRELFRAKNAPQRELRDRYELVLDYMVRVLQRGRFDVFMDPATGRLELREVLPEPNPLGLDLPVDRAGHGVVQAFAILVTILLSGAPIVAIEEPEAHLHAPTLGRRLRALLPQLRADGHVQQFFIATHSNLFDLDPGGYFDVSLDPDAHETRVQRKPLVAIDESHLYEPGPAKHALAQLLRYAPPEEVVFRRPDQSPITAAEMLVLLQEDAAVAVEFLRSLHGAALRIVRLDARKRGPA